MKYIKEVIYAIISLILSFWMFDASILAICFIFCGLNSIAEISKSDFRTPQKTMSYRIAIIACICGGILIFLGNKVFNNDIIVIIGAFIFAPTFASLFVRELIVVISYLGKNVKK